MTEHSRHRFIVGVDLGGTNIVTGALSADGSRTFGVRSAPTDVSAGTEGVVDRIVAQIEATVADTMRDAGVSREAFLGIGIGAPGPLDRERGIVIVAPNLGWRDFPLRDRISARTGLPATLDNDANCATVG
jgi:glucokinase